MWFNMIYIYGLPENVSIPMVLIWFTWRLTKLPLDSVDEIPHEIVELCMGQLSLQLCGTDHLAGDPLREPRYLDVETTCVDEERQNHDVPLKPLEHANVPFRPWWSLMAKCQTANLALMSSGPQKWVGLGTEGSAIQDPYSAVCHVPKVSSCFFTKQNHFCHKLRPSPYQCTPHLSGHQRWFQPVGRCAPSALHRWL